MDAVTIKVPASIGLAIEVETGGVPITEPLGKTEIMAILDMALRARVVEKRIHQDGGNFYGATDNCTAL